MRIGMRARYWLAGLAAVALLGGAAVSVVQMLREDSKPRPAVTLQTSGYALNTPFMRYCQEQNPYIFDRSQQLGFLHNHEVLALGDSVDRVMLDYTVPNPSGYEVQVRYYAGPSNERPCTFGLVRTANHRERDAAVQRFTRNNQPFVPMGEQFCRSTIPPFILPDAQANRSVVQLRCDFVD